LGAAAAVEAAGALGAAAEVTAEVADEDGAARLAEFTEGVATTTAGETAW
jgi:hypothetical protein